MKVYLATDHAGFALKEKIKTFLLEKKYEVEDYGAFAFTPGDDYPDFIQLAAAKVAQNPEDRALIFGGSGEAEAMVANKFPGVRAALFYGPRVPLAAADVTGRVSTDEYELIRLTREHNNANVLSLGARFVTEEEAQHAVEMWLAEPFPGEDRHVRRIEEISRIEESI